MILVASYCWSLFVESMTRANCDLIITKYTVSESLMSLVVCCNDMLQIIFAEHGKLVAESSEFQLMLIRAYKARIFSNSKYAKKRDILSEKRESGMVLKKREFTPEICINPYPSFMHRCTVGLVGAYLHWATSVVSCHLPCTATLSMPRPTHFNVKLPLISSHLQ